jgi:Tfp pilus assembly protein PilF
MMTRIRLIGCCCTLVLLTVSSAAFCVDLPLNAFPSFLYSTPLLDDSHTSSGQSNQNTAEPRVSATIFKPLQAAQRAVRSKNFDAAIAKIREAQAHDVARTDYDNFFISVLLIQSYLGKNDMAELVQALADAVQSKYATSDQKKSGYKFIAGYRFYQKDYNKALDAAKQAQQHGASDTDTMDLIAKTQYRSENYAEAASTMREIVSQQETPDEDSLKRLWQFDLMAKDDAGAASAMEELVALYPKPEYWQIALAPLVRVNSKDPRLQLNVYRLMSDVGALKTSGDYDDMAHIALDLGYPSEAASVLQEALQKNIFSEQRDKDLYEHLLDRSRLRAATDQAELDKSKPADGNGLVQLAAAYMSYGQYDKAGDKIKEAIARGDLKSSDEAYLLLGIAELRINQTADARSAFDKVATSSDTSYSRLAVLWAARTGSWSPRAIQH